ncbi:MAG: DUF1259 domain-containing protein [Deltaproteobacteria bacterium]|nr:DUF1259 domain-containing protein [Deltaproteobacteria bacterium]
MKRLTVTGMFLLSIAVFSGPLSLAWAAADFSKVDGILGAKGQMQEGAWVVRFPRNDLKVRINGEDIPTAEGFGGWVAFKDMGKKTMVMGDLALLEEEVNPVISALQGGGLQITALHNHFLHEQPRIMFMHLEGAGNKESLATGIRQALSQTGLTKSGAHAPATIPGVAPPPSPGATSASAPAAAPEAKPQTSPALESAPAAASRANLDTKRLEEIIGHPGQLTGEVFKITVGRKGFKMQGMELTSSQGLNSWVAFVGAKDRAHAAGDILMTAKEVNRVIKTLRAGGIEVVAVHNHMLTEAPRAFFLHYWGTGPAEKLAQTVRAAFDEVKAPAK